MAHSELSYTKEGSNEQIEDPINAGVFFFNKKGLFPKPKNVLNGRHFGTLENIHKTETDILNTTAVEAFQRCYQKWKQRFHPYVAAQRNYFEGDKIDVCNK